MTQLVRFDTNALNALNRALIGFDDVFNNFERRFANQVSNNYPPYNVVKIDENLYEIQIAVTGFEKQELSVSVDQDQLIVKGESMTTDYAPEQYLHRGLASRDFEKSWTLADHMEVDSVEIKNGLLKIKIVRIVPEALKPRQLEIKQSD
jgi:molecular chaperone IbpA